MDQVLTQLAEANRSGAPFLLAYGATWLVCWVVWVRGRPRVAAFVTLFQGMVALPAALGLLAALGAFENRPELGSLNDLSVMVSVSQLLVLPLLIVMIRRGQYGLVPLVWSAAGAMHFLMYTWLYRTPAYAVMSVGIALGLAVVHGRDRGDGSPPDSAVVSVRAAGHACALTGVALIVTGVYLIAA